MTESARPRARAGGFAALVAAGILLSRLAGLVREKVFAYYFGSSDCGRRVQGRRSASRIFSRTCSEKGCSRHPSFPCTRGCWRGRRRAGGTRGWRRGGAARGGDGDFCRAGRHLRAGAVVGHRTRVSKGEVRQLTITRRARSLSRHRPARSLRLVPWHPEQPPQVLPRLRRARADEREPDRDDVRLRPDSFDA